MNTNSAAGYLLWQLLWQSPVLLAYVIGMVVCAVRVRRAPLAATLAIVGLGLMLIASVAVMLVQAMLFPAGGASVASRAWTLSVVGFGGMLLRTAGVVLMIGAVFAGRPRQVGGGFEVPVGAGR